MSEELSSLDAEAFAFFRAGTTQPAEWWQFTDLQKNHWRAIAKKAREIYRPTQAFKVIAPRHCECCGPSGEVRAQVDATAEILAWHKAGILSAEAVKERYGL